MQTLLDGAKQFGGLVTRRWSYISRYVAERTKGFDNLPRFLVGERCSEIFKATEADCRMMRKVLLEKYPAVVEFAKSEKSTFFNGAEKDAFKPVVIVPPIIFCCKEKIQVRNSVAMAHVYRTHGTTIAAIFHGVCSICGVKYFHCYKEKTITLDEEEKKEWYFYSPANESKYFQISSETFFEKSFLAETSASVEIGACSFQSRCEVYNEVHRAKDNSRLSPLMSCLSRKPQSAFRDDCRTCDFHPFLERLAKSGNLGAQLLLSKVKFLVDKFHCEKHAEATCFPPDNPRCKYHPDLERFSEIQGTNTECAEQFFKWLGSFKYMCKKMLRYRFVFFCGMLWTGTTKEKKGSSRKLG